MLAIADPPLAQALEAYRRGLHDQVVAKDVRLQALGSTAYLEQMERG
jgi:5-(carboxyamino)imidazole ribonucleotide mutase